MVSQQKARPLQWLGQLRSPLNTLEVRNSLTPTVLSVTVREAAGQIWARRFFTGFIILAIMETRAFILLFREVSSLITGDLGTCPGLTASTKET